jgi:O-antigen ligase
MSEAHAETMVRRGMRPIGIVSAAFWAAGTNLLADRWYIAHGISIGDLLFAGWLMLALAVPSMRRRFAWAVRTIPEHLVLIGIFITLLLVSTAYNAFRFGMQWSDLFAILRLVYFVVIIVFTIVFVREYGSWPIVVGFLIGVTGLAVGRLNDAIVTGGHALFGVPLFRDPNVIGNMLGVGTFFASLGVLAGHLVLPLAFVVAFVVLSVFTFSKGTWLMVAIALLANFVALALRYPLSAKGVMKLTAACAAVVIVLGIPAYRNAETLTNLLSFKLFTTEDSETASYRYRFALAGTYAMLDHPVVGLGFRNYGATLHLYPDVMPEPSENAHNVFVQIGAVAGVPALAVFLLLFWYPFPQLIRILWARGHRLGGAAYVGLALLVFAASGSVQLQLMAQPFFWLFTGLVRAGRVVGAPAGRDLA